MRAWPRTIAAVLMLSAVGAAAQTKSELAVFAAGSLRAPLTEIAQAYEARQAGLRIVLTFGASGLLKDRIQAGERADVFASANMEHPQALAAAGKASAVQRFARNALCALAGPTVAVTSDSLVDRLLDPAVKVGTSTPKADPSGDYAWLMFEQIEQRGRAGAFKALTAKALQLTGGPNSPPPPAGRSVYAALVGDGKADIFITYCTNAKAAAREQPGLQVIAVPDSINVSADYGVTRTTAAVPAAADFVEFLLGAGGQAILARHGFVAGTTTGAVSVGGDVKRPAAIGPDALRAFAAPAQSTVKSSRDVDGRQQHSVVRGVTLRAVLEQAGLAERDRFDWRKTVVIAIARDNYRAVFSWPELFNTEAGAQVMLAYERDGTPLGTGEGPIALHAPGDTRTGPRHVKWLKRIEVRILRD